MSQEHHITLSCRLFCTLFTDMAELYAKDNDTDDAVAVLVKLLDELEKQKHSTLHDIQVLELELQSALSDPNTFLQRLREVCIRHHAV